jgi:hypothetical protein
MTSFNRLRPRSALPNLDPQILGTLKSLLLRVPRRLDDYYDIGEQMESLECLIAAAPGKARGNNWRQQLARNLEVSDSTLSKCLQFRRRFKKGDLPRLKKLKTTWALLSISFGIEDKKERFSLLEKAIEDGWDDRTLQREIHRRKGTCRGGGRKRKEPRSQGLLADVLELAIVSEMWNRFYEKVWAQYQNGTTRGQKHIDADVLQKQLNHAAEMVEALQTDSGQALKAIKALLATIPKKHIAST